MTTQAIEPRTSDMADAVDNAVDDTEIPFIRDSKTSQAKRQQHAKQLHDKLLIGSPFGVRIRN